MNIYMAGQIGRCGDWRTDLLKDQFNRENGWVNNKNLWGWQYGYDEPDLELADYPGLFYCGPFFDAQGHGQIGFTHGTDDSQSTAFDNDMKQISRADVLFAWLQGQALGRLSYDDYHFWHEMVSLYPHLHLTAPEICKEFLVSLGQTFPMTSGLMPIDGFGDVAWGDDLKIETVRSLLCGDTITVGGKTVWGKEIGFYITPDGIVRSQLHVEAYGTLFEMGVAFQRGIPVFAGIETGLCTPELWFPLQATKGYVHHDSPELAFKYIYEEHFAPIEREPVKTFVSPHYRALHKGKPSEKARRNADKYGFYIPLGDNDDN